MEKKTDDKKKVPLKDEELEQVNGGFKIILWDIPKGIKNLFKILFRVKDRKED